MSWVARIPLPHPCTPPRNSWRRQTGFSPGSRWRCGCGRVWQYYDNWAGDGWTEVLP